MTASVVLEKAPAPPAVRAARALAALALVAGVLSALAELLAGPAYRISALPLGAAIQTMRWGATVALGAAAVALVALLLSVASNAPVRGMAALALVLALVVAAPPLYMYRQLQHLPKIHDISTNTEDPPKFDAVLPLRQSARNPVDYPASTAAEQRNGYPDIEPLMLPLAPPAAFERAAKAAGEMGWDIVATSPETLRLEATDTTLLFGFKDDVVVRVTPQAQGSVVDVRSLSRVGGSDFGANAKRVRAYLKRLADSVATP
ncbi:MAG TPA: DUF1499 domain-containing protein [Burkholderiaceae bacterium]|nr:DUF1499 domain-containing protein [Burkholderiaceae bacterium]